MRHKYSMATIPEPDLITVPVDLEYLYDKADKETADGQCVDPAVYVGNPEADNKEIDDHAGDVAFTAFTPKYDIDTTSFESHKFSPSFMDLCKTYGNNAFELEVEYTHLFGVLKEIPPLSMSSKWHPNVVSDLIDSLKKMQANSKIQTINSLFGVAQIPWVAGGNSTSQTYTGCGDATFNLQFRIYSMEAIGPSNLMSGYKRVLAALCLYSPPLHTFDANSILSLSVVNLGRTATALANAINNTIDFAAYKMGVVNPQNSQKKREEIQQSLTNGLQHLGDIGTAAMSAFRADNSSERIQQFNELSKAIENSVKDLEGVLVDEQLSQDDKTRVDDPINWYRGYYGGALWHLSILPGIFRRKIPVYIQSWTAKPSKEIDSTGKAAYMDFNVTCVLDQVKTGNWWANEIYAPEADAYKNYYRKQVKEPS